MIGAPDYELVKDIKAGDEVAFEILLVRYRPVLTKLCRRYFINHYEFDDFYQVATMGMYDAARNFNEQMESSFYAYALACVRNELISLCRKELPKKLEVEILGIVPACVDVMIAENHPALGYQAPPVLEEEQMEPETMEERFRLRLKELLTEGSILTDIERQCAELFANEKSYQDIAETLNVPHKTVDNALTRVRGKLKEERNILLREHLKKQ